MPAIHLTTRRVEKPWGRHRLWPGFDDPSPDGEPIGEVWFEDSRPDCSSADPDLLIKYLFTSERLSIQVHPDDAMARSMGQKRGKDEAWVVLGTEPEATIGIGLRRTLTPDELRAAALDASIEQLLDWKPVAPGDVFFSPAGTIHAIGAGVTLIEVQQNSDTTFRLYDYGRPRELHIDESVAAANPAPYVAPYSPREIEEGRIVLADSPAFVLERWSGARRVTLPGGAPVWLIPLRNGGDADGEPLRPGGVWLAQGETVLTLDADSDLLLAYKGPMLAPMPA